MHATISYYLLQKVNMNWAETSVHKNALGCTEIFSNVLQSMPTELKYSFQPDEGKKRNEFASPCVRANGCTLNLIGIHVYIELV